MKERLERHATEMRERNKITGIVELGAPRSRAPLDLSPPPPLVDEVDLLKLNDKEWRTLWHNTRVRWSIAVQVRDLRLSRGWSQEALAEKADTNQATISRIEDPNGECPTLNTLMRIGAAFDCAFVCRFCGWKEWLSWQRSLEIDPSNVPSFADDKGFDAASQAFSGVDTENDKPTANETSVEAKT